MEEANIHHRQYKPKNLFRNKDQEMGLFHTRRSGFDTGIATRKAAVCIRIE